jgi:tRNA threonylcarbamoyladenosine biosynthesis protein TsaB
LPVLQAPATTTDADAPVLAAIDARMGELYLGLFRRDPVALLAAVGAEWMAPPALPGLPAIARLRGVGSGFAADAGALAEALGASLRQFDAQALPHAADIARLAALAFARGEAISADQLEPAYLRDKVALTLIEQAESRRK